MQKIRNIGLAILVLLMLTPSGLAAPDTPPALTTTVTLGEPTAVTCTAAGDTATQLLTFTSDALGNIYTAESCGTAPASIVVRKVLSTGVATWSKVFSCGINSCGLQGLAVDASDGIMVAYNNPSYATVAKTDMTIMRASDGTALCSKSPEGMDPFTVALGGATTNPQGASRKVNASEYHYYFGGATGIQAVKRTVIAGISVCSTVWGRSDLGADRGWSYNLVNTGLYVTDFQSPNEIIAAINLTSGATIASANAGTIGGFVAYVNSTGLRLLQAHLGAIPNPVHSYDEYNATTMGQTRDNVAVTENTILYSAAQRNLNLETWDMDISRNAFTCGRLAGVSSGNDAVLYISKYTMGAVSAQRWNITFAGNGCRAHISPDGSLWVGFYNIISPLNNPQSYLRKYAGVATPRSRDSYVAPDSGSTSTAAPGNIIADIRNRLEENWGFDFGWLMGLGIVGLITWRVRRAAPLVIAILAFLGLGVAVRLDLLPEWILFVSVFIIIAVAGGRLFMDTNEDGD